MKKLTLVATWMMALGLPLCANAYESGSTGADGAFNPTASMALTLPPSGILNFTDINIPAGVTVSFTKNATNTPVVFLASGDVTIDGAIHVNGFTGGASGSGTGGIGGAPGPGGFAGGHGGLRSNTGQSGGSNGLGPGGGSGGSISGTYAGGGGFGSAGQAGHVSGGSAYGSANLRTLIGGSGGGGAGGSSSTGSGGGGGGGAIAIAASGAIRVNGSIIARGGSAGSANAGSGSGGAIRLVATTMQGNGGITASANGAGTNGGVGRIRIEAETMLRAANSSPAFSFTAPNPIFYANAPSVRIASIGGIAVPAGPTGFRDVVLPGLTTNPVTVGLETTNVPVGTTISLKALPERGSVTSATSTAVAGSNALGTATADINLPPANSTLFGTVSFTITLADNSQAADYSKYAQGEKVEKLRIDVNTEGVSETTFMTASGKEYTWPSNAVAFN